MNKNKGFSLVELIVVVAIMAVLVGILAPAYLSYVEKTRRGTDENMAEEVRHTIEVSAAELCVYDQLDDGDSFTFSMNSAIANACSASNELQAAMTEVYSDKTFDIKSKKYATKGYTVTISKPNTAGAALTVNGAWN